MSVRITLVDIHNEPIGEADLDPPLPIVGERFEALGQVWELQQISAPDAPALGTVYIVAPVKNL